MGDGARSAEGRFVGVCELTPQVASAICRRLANGESLVAIADDPGMPCYGTVFKWLKAYPDFADAYATARMAPRKYCERVMVDAEVAARRAQADDEDKALTVHLVNFQLAPDRKTVLVAPPRCAQEEQDWVEAYGRPYDGPR